jgi:hypothetical protein
VIRGVPTPSINDVHIVFDGGSPGGWSVKVHGSSGARSTHASMAEAVQAGERLANAKEALLFIHDEDGVIQR